MNEHNSEKMLYMKTQKVQKEKIMKLFIFLKNLNIEGGRKTLAMGIVGRQKCFIRKGRVLHDLIATICGSRNKSGRYSVTPPKDFVNEFFAKKRHSPT